MSWDPMLLEYLLGSTGQQSPGFVRDEPSFQVTTPPSWSVGQAQPSRAPAQEPQPSAAPSINLMDYFRAMRPELYSQESMDRAIADDKETNQNREMARSFSRAVGHFTNDAPDYTGLGPTDRAVKELGLRQDQAMKSAEVGVKVAQLAQTAGAMDPRSAASLMAYRNAAQFYGSAFTARFRPGDVNANEIAAWISAKKGYSDIEKEDAAAAASRAEAADKTATLPGRLEKTSAETAKARAETATEEAMRPGKVKAQNSFEQVHDAWGNTVGYFDKHSGKMVATPPAMSGGGPTAPVAGPDGKPIVWGELTRDQQLKVAAGIGGGMMDPASLISRAQAFAREGVHPPAGNNKAKALQNTLVEKLANIIDPNLDISGKKATYKGDTESLAALTKMVDASEAYEGTAIRNLDMTLDKSERIVDAGSPLLNKPARWFAQNVSGDPKVAEFAAAREAAAAEVSKVLSGAFGAGAITDSQRHAIEKMLPPDASWAQIRAAAATLKAEMHNRRVEYRAKMEEQKKRVSSLPAPAAPGAVPAGQRPPGAAYYSPSTKKYYDANGKEL